MSGRAPFRFPLALATLWLCVPPICASASGPQQEPVPLAPPQQVQPAGTGLQSSLDEAFAAYLKGEFERARGLAEAALLRSRADGDQHAEGYALLLLGMVATSGSEYPKSRPLLEQSLAIFEREGEQLWIARAQTQLGALSRLEGKHEEANTRYQKALNGFEAIGDQRGKAAVLRDIGGHDREVVEIARSIRDKRMEANALHRWGDYLFTDGDFAEAQEKTERAGRLYQELGDRRDYGRVLTSLGRLQRAHGRVQDAIQLYQQALEIQVETGDKLGEVQSLNAIAVSYGYLGQDETAREYLVRALALAQQTGSARAVDFIEGALASNATDRGDFDCAEATLKGIIARGADENPDSRYMALTHVYAVQHRYEEALAAANKGVELAKQRRPEKVPTFLADRADVERHLNQIEQARTDLVDAVQLLEEQRRHLVATDFMKAGFSEFYQRIFSASIALHEQMGEPESALEVAESARARAFIDLLATRSVQLREKDQTAIAEFREEDRGSASGAARTEPDPFGLTFRGDPRRPQPVQKLRGSDPGLVSFVSVEPPKKEEIVAAAKRLHSTLLCYWTADDESFVWIISPTGKINTSRIDAPGKRLAGLVHTTTSLSAAKTTDENKPLRARGGSIGLPRNSDAAWRSLYDLLIAPIRADLPMAPGSRITIIPHGPLTGLSFAALKSPRNRYLVEDYEIHYAPSVSLLVHGGFDKPRTSLKERTFLLVADPVSRPTRRGEPQLPRLPAARAEVSAIARRFPAGSSMVLMDADASESAFRDAVRGRSVLHLATHAIVNSEQPLDSYLLLSGDGTSTTNDGRLTATEIYGLDLSADLVVLSACSTGTANGRDAGEGIAHLARAFFYAGSSSMMVTLWDVEDTASAQLLTHFYERWPAKQDKSTALREAQLSMIKQLRGGNIRAQTAAGPLVLPEHPFFWAGFVLLGEP